MNWLVLTDERVVEELRERCRLERLSRNIRQVDLAERAGVSITTLRRFETDAESSPSLESFVRIVRALGGLDVLEQLFGARPLDPLNLESTGRERARRTPSSTAEPASDWAWGDEQ